MRRLLLAIIPFFVVGTLACQGSNAEESQPSNSGDLERSGSPDYVILDDQGEPFVASFDADAGKVRLVMYVSPT